MQVRALQNKPSEKQVRKFPFYSYADMTSQTLLCTYSGDIMSLQGTAYSHLYNKILF
jgi:hypothetical protein